MAGRKRSTPYNVGKSSKDLTRSARAYRALLSKGERHLKAVRGGYKGAITKLKKKLEEAQKQGPGGEAGEIVLFEATGDEPRLTGFGEFNGHDVQRPDWLVHVEYRQEGTIVDETDVRVQMRVEQESEGTAIRREIKAAVEGFRSEHQGDESPTVAVQRLAIVRGG